MTERIQIHELSERLAAGESPRLVDVRTPMEFRAVHARGAVSLPLNQLTPERAAQFEGSGSGPTYVLCKSGARAGRACEQVADLGLGWIAIEGGTDAWAAAGLPVERSAGGPISLERQVRIAAGLLVTVGTVLGFGVHPGFHALSGAVGLGVTFAGVTGACGMGMVLARMPWNRAPSGA